MDTPIVANRLGRELLDADLVVLGHMHEDHAAGLHRLPHAEVHVHEADVEEVDAIVDRRDLHGAAHRQQVELRMVEDVRAAAEVVGALSEPAQHARDPARGKPQAHELGGAQSKLRDRVALASERVAEEPEVLVEAELGHGPHELAHVPADAVAVDERRAIVDGHAHADYLTCDL